MYVHCVGGQPLFLSFIGSPNYPVPFSKNFLELVVLVLVLDKKFALV